MVCEGPTVVVDGLGGVWREHADVVRPVSGVSGEEVWAQLGVALVLVEAQGGGVQSDGTAVVVDGLGGVAGVRRRCQANSWRLRNRFRLSWVCRGFCLRQRVVGFSVMTQQWWLMRWGMWQGVCRRCQASSWRL